MKTNKLTIEEQFLTIEQAKELQALGIDFSGANMFVFFDGRIISKNEAEFMTISSNACNSLNVALPIIHPILSVAEMLEMLPKCIEVKDVLYELYLKKSSFYVKNIAYELGYREYLKESLGINEFTHILLRDSLFEMIKWLKQNKLI